MVNPKIKTANPTVRLTGKGGKSGNKNVRSKNLPMKYVRMGTAMKMKAYAATALQPRRGNLSAAWLILVFTMLAPPSTL
jgi:hypothetical protein